MPFTTFVKFDSKASGCTSPLLDDIILTTILPKPIKTFVGREKELEELHELLEEHRLAIFRLCPAIIS